MIWTEQKSENKVGEVLLTMCQLRVSICVQIWRY